MPETISIYHPITASLPRLNYTLGWIFGTQFQVSYALFTDYETWKNQSGIKLNYSNEDFPEEDIRIKPQGLLNQQGLIKPIPLAVQRWKHTTVLFYNQPGGTIPFDLFAATFYLLSRYEEYLNFTPDKHGRFSASSSAAGQFRFLTEPVIDQWLFHFKNILSSKGLIIPEKAFEWRITYDIDMAWKYRYKSRFRSLGAQAKDLLKLNFRSVKERMDVLADKKEDPYFSFDKLEALHEKFNLSPTYFFLIGENDEFDRNTPGGHPEMKALIQKIAKRYEIGIHPSYHSHQDRRTLKEEKDLLTSISSKEITRSRQHFIKFTLPETYRKLIATGITEDYTMGYPEENGFRAGTSNSFFWYDLKEEQKTNLKVQPFAFMDATSVFYKKQDTGQMMKEWERIFFKIKAVNGCFYSIFHNYILSIDSKEMEAYENIIEIANQQSNKSDSIR